MSTGGKAKTDFTYDAIVIGSGISGGWAAKELCEKGLKTLVLERGRAVKHKADYPTAMHNPWDLPLRGALSRELRESNPIADRCYAFGEATQHFFVKDHEHPYVQEKPFDWIRGYQEGGKSLLWARQVQRWSPFDFEAPLRDGYAVDWPIRYHDLAPWYAHVERFIGVSGNRDGLETLPDSESLPAFEMNCAEKHIADAIRKHYSDRYPVIGRCAHLTRPQPIHLQQGRGQCMMRTLCERGCPYGGYFSSNASTLPWAAGTGNMTMKTDSIVHSILYDEKKGKAVGVKVLDAHTKEERDYYARVIFVNAATLNTNLLLLNSTSRRFTDGLGNDNGLLGHYIAFHNYRGSITASIDGFEDAYYFGRRPAAVMMPSYRNVYRHEMDFKRGYMVFFSAARAGWNRGESRDLLGEELKKQAAQPGPWSVYMMMQGETLPKKENHVRLSKELNDPFGIPQLVVSVGYDENDDRIVEDFLSTGVAMLQSAGCRNIRPSDNKQAPGLDIHEMGGVRMGRDAGTSLLNEWNQLHHCKNVYVTDGACMTSTGTQNPSLTFMALTARAANHAVKQLKDGAL